LDHVGGIGGSIQNDKSKRDEFFSSNSIVFGGMGGNDWESSIKKFEGLKLIEEEIIRISEIIIDDNDLKKCVNDEIDKRIFMLKNYVSTNMLKELSSTFNSSKKVLLIGQVGAGKSSLTNVLMNCTEDDLDFIQYAHVPDNSEKEKTSTIFVKSYPVLGNLNVVDFVGLDILGDEINAIKILKRIAKGKYPPPEKIFNPKAQYIPQKGYIPDFVYWVIECPSIAPSNINVKDFYNHLRKIFRHENIFIIFNKMDHFLNDHPVGSSFNLTRENLKDINFNLQGFVVEEEKLVEDSLDINNPDEENLVDDIFRYQQSR